MNRINREIATRAPLVTVCALTAIASWNLPCQANDRPVDPPPDSDSDISTSAADLLPLAPSNVAAPIAAPETVMMSAAPSPAAVSVATEAQPETESQAVVVPAMAASDANLTPMASVQAETIRPISAVATPETLALPVKEANPIAAAFKDSPANDSTLSDLPERELRLAAAPLLTDIQGNWAEEFIRPLADQDVLEGFPSRQYRPNATMTRAEYAAMVQQMLRKRPDLAKPDVRESASFVDVPLNYWAYTAIQTAYRKGFLGGYPGNRFQPDQSIPRVQVLTSLVQGIDLSAATVQSGQLDTYFEDAADIPEYAKDSIAAAVENRLVVNYPDVRQLNPNQPTTRADAAAFIHQALVKAGTLTPLPTTASAYPYIVNPVTATTPPPEPVVTLPSAEQIQTLQSRLQALKGTRNFGDTFQGSPAISIANPTGFGADDWTAFLGGSFQSRTRYSDKKDGTAVVGIGVGDSRKTVGAEFSYTLGSFGTNLDFGSGGFNAKIHRQFANDWAAAVGWNGFASIGEEPDFRNSVYGTVTKVLRTRDDVNLPFSRVALTFGVGSGQFRSEDDVAKDINSINAFGSLAVRVAQPLSFIAEWTGQDLAMGLSIVPIKNVNWVITPAVRDITGAGDGPRFVLGTGISFKF